MNVFFGAPSKSSKRPDVSLEQMSDEVLIIGGGFAGLTAGVALADAGQRVRLLEQRPHLGGRAFSFPESNTGSIVDNGQHLFMGCYHQTKRFLETIGTIDRVQFQPVLSVPFLDANGKLTKLACPRLPAPWHLFLGLLGSDSFAWGEKLGALRMKRAISAKHASNGFRRLTVDKWLASLGQSDSMRRNFWDLICIAAMNEQPSVAAAELFQRVLKLALFSSLEDSRLGIARVGLSECYTEAATNFIVARGGRVELSCGVRNLLVSDGACGGVVLVSGETIPAKTVLSTAPWHKFITLLPDSLLRSEPFFTNILALEPAPIISINLWLDRPVTDLEFAGLRGTTIQWLFNKSIIFSEGGRQAGGARPHYLSLVLSGAHEHIARSKEELLAIAVNDLQKLLPAMSEAKLVHSLVIKERYATFSPAVGVNALRPRAVTPVRGLYLAGDWTDTGLPATIEGAIQSGYTAAQEILVNE